MATLSQIPTKKELMNWCGYLSFHCALMNLDFVGIRSRKSGETVLITYRGGYKTGSIYEGGNLTREDVNQFFLDAPDYSEDFETDYLPKYGHLVELYYPRKDMYVWINENEIAPVKTTKKNLQQ